MYDKEKELFAAFAAKKMSRREMLDRARQAGLSVAAASVLLNSAATRALAADFDWKKFKGNKLKLLLNKHPYADAMIADIDNFKTLTGMDVSYDIFPEDVYFDKVTAALSSSSSEYDAFMTGAYMTWTYGPAGWIADLNEYIKDPAKTNPNYNWEDVLPGLRASTAWNGVPGGELGSADAKQWCVPWGYELNNIAYNRTMFDKVGVQPPKNLEDMVAVSAKLTKDAGGPYGIGVRGSRSWATIHPGFLSGYSNFGQRDFTVTDGKLKAAMNTAESKSFHKLWVQMIQDSGPKNWATYTWYQVGTDLGAGASAMIYDADILGYFMNGGDNKEKGQIGYAPFAANPAAKAPTPNVWIWSLAMNAFGKAANLELKGSGIHVMTVCPGYVKTDFGANAIKGSDAKTVRPSSVRGISAQRVAGAVLRGYLKQRREVVVPWTMHPAIKVYQLFPGLVERTMAKMSRRVD